MNPDEWKLLRKAVGPVLAARSYGTQEYRQEAVARAGVVLDALRSLGCHPSVLANPKAHQLTVKEVDGALAVQWKRPKTRNWCLMPVNKDLAERLTLYTQTPWSRKTIWRLVRDCAAHAGLGEVGPLTIRHTVATDLVRRFGPMMAKESLAVGDRALQHYTALSASTRLRLLREPQEKV